MTDPTVSDKSWNTFIASMIECGKCSDYEALCARLLSLPEEAEQAGTYIKIWKERGVRPRSYEVPDVLEEKILEAGDVVDWSTLVSVSQWMRENWRG